MGKRPYTEQDRLASFDRRYIPEPNSGCWIWIGGHMNGYGQIKRDGRNVAAHRYSYEINRGPIPDGLVLDHLCRVQLCVNPDHLEPVTIGENISRGDNHHRRKTRCNRGHPYNEENTLILRTGRGKTGISRTCRICASARSKAWREENNAA